MSNSAYIVHIQFGSILLILEVHIPLMKLMLSFVYFYLLCCYPAHAMNLPDFAAILYQHLYYWKFQVLEADLAILDEIDSGLDVDALQDVAKAVNLLLTPHNSILMITHYQRLLDYIKPNYVHIMVSDLKLENKCQLFNLF